MSDVTLKAQFCLKKCLEEELRILANQSGGQLISQDRKAPEKSGLCPGELPADHKKMVPQNTGHLKGPNCVEPWKWQTL